MPHNASGAKKLLNVSVSMDDYPLTGSHQGHDDFFDIGFQHMGCYKTIEVNKFLASKEREHGRVILAFSLVGKWLSVETPP